MKNQSQISEILEGKIFAVVGYFFALCIIPLAFKKNNQFALFHGKQALVLFIGEVAVFILSILPTLGPVIFRLGVFIFGAASIWGMIQALKGQYAKIPFVDKIADKIII